MTSATSIKRRLACTQQQQQGCGDVMSGRVANAMRFNDDGRYCMSIADVVSNMTPAFV